MNALAQGQHDDNHSVLVGTPLFRPRNLFETTVILACWVHSPRTAFAAAMYRVPDRLHIVSSHATPRFDLQVTLQTICLHISFPLSPYASATLQPMTHITHPLSTHEPTSVSRKREKQNSRESHACLPRLPPYRLPTAPAFQLVTQHHAVCRVVSGVSSLRLHPLLTVIQVSGAEGRHCVSSLRRRSRRAYGGGLD